VNSSKVVWLAENVVDLAERLKEDVYCDQPKRELFQDMFTLRRSVEQLEQQVRDSASDTIGDAC